MPELPETGPDFAKAGGLVPAIAQDAETGEVLMMAYMNAESYAETVATGRAVVDRQGPLLRNARMGVAVGPLVAIQHPRIFEPEVQRFDAKIHAA